MDLRLVGDIGNCTLDSLVPLKILRNFIFQKLNPTRLFVPTRQLGPSEYV